MPSRARSRSCSTVQSDDATPITGTLRSPRLTMLYSDGKTFLWARSPDAPKNTRASEGTGLDAISVLLLVVAAELLAHGREDAIGEVGLTARREPLVQRRREHRSRHPLVDRGEDRPAALARVGDASLEVGELGRLTERVRGEVEEP